MSCPDGIKVARGSRIAVRESAGPRVPVQCADGGTGCVQGSGAVEQTRPDSQIRSGDAGPALLCGPCQPRLAWRLRPRAPRWPSEAMRLTATAVSDIGRVRKTNQDSVGCFDDLSLYLLSDGMGGLTDGEVASRLAIDVIRDKVAQGERQRTGARRRPRRAARRDRARQRAHPERGRAAR